MFEAAWIIGRRLLGSKTFWIVLALLALLSLAAGGLSIYGGARYAAGERAQLGRDNARILALTTDLGTCRTNTEKLRNTINEQNSRIATAAKESADRLATAAAGLAQGQEYTAQANARIAQLMKPLKLSEQCAKMQEADARLKEALK